MSIIKIIISIVIQLLRGIFSTLALFTEGLSKLFGKLAEGMEILADIAEDETEEDDTQTDEELPEEGENEEGDLA